MVHVQYGYPNKFKQTFDIALTSKECLDGGKSNEKNALLEGFSTANELQLKTFDDLMSKVDLSIKTEQFVDS